MREKFKIIVEYYKKNRKPISLLVAISIFASILTRRPMGSETPTGNETFALLMFSIILWISNPLPIYVTALLAPILAVWLKVLIKESSGSLGVQLDRKDAGELVLKFMVNRIVTVALGGFVLAKALNKSLHGITYPANLFLKYARTGKSFCWLLLLLILIPMYLSALIPHEAAVIISFNLISPIIYALPVDSELAKVSLLALMLGGNLGGMLSSISTPQNILLFTSSEETKKFNLTFFIWAKVSFPVTFVSALGVWTGLLLIWRPWRLKLSSSVKSSLDSLESCNSPSISTTKSSAAAASIISDSIESYSNTPIKLDKIPLINNTSKPLTPILKYWTIFVTLITVFLWLSARRLENVFGGLGIVSLVPIVALFGSGVLGKDDLHELPWDVILLAMGATTLSAICKNSGLFDLIEKEFETILGPLKGWSSIALLCFVMTISSAIKSRYIAALVYLPLAFRAIGSISSNDAAGMGFIVGQKILVAFACSAGMLLPISGLINAFILEIRPIHSEDKDERYITNNELTVAGALGTTMAFLSIISVGYLMIKLL